MGDFSMFDIETTEKNDTPMSHKIIFKKIAKPLLRQATHFFDNRRK